MIYFAHGNGFPGQCYQQLLTALSIQYDYCYIDKIGHSIDYPVTDCWLYLVDELINDIEKKADMPVIGIGHSLGGVLNFMAAKKKPELFKAVIMLDSPLLNCFKSLVVKLAKLTGLIDRLTPAHRTKNRKQRWQTREELLAYLHSKPLFTTFASQCLQDYIDYGCVESSEGYSLQFDPMIEYLIYRTVPHRMPDYKKNVHLPTALIYGDKSDVVDKYDVRYMSQKHGILCHKIAGTHMLPMENPSHLAERIISILQEMF